MRMETKENNTITEGKIDMAGNGLSFLSLTPRATKDEAALYDRQIRLWGLESQQRYTKIDTFDLNLKRTTD